MLGRVMASKLDARNWLITALKIKSYKQTKQSLELYPTLPLGSSYGIIPFYALRYTSYLIFHSSADFAISESTCS